MGTVIVVSTLAEIYLSIEEDDNERLGFRPEF